jgi:undecaprenyl-diphosphatase
VLAAAIGLSRIYVGVHWPLDVLGGAVLGTVVGLASIALLRLAAARRRSPRETPAG